jgi:hypothetical protein
LVSIDQASAWLLRTAQKQIETMNHRLTRVNLIVRHGVTFTQVVNSGDLRPNSRVTERSISRVPPSMQGRLASRRSAIDANMILIAV